MTCSTSRHRGQASVVLRRGRQMFRGQKKKIKAVEEEPREGEHLSVVCVVAALASTNVIAELQGTN